jgi:hypothetical protein
MKMRMNKIINIAAFAILTLLWLAFGAALIFNRAILDTVWLSFRSLPLLAQVGAGLLVLPVALGLWVWEASWPLWPRLILVIVLGVATIYTFFPRQSKILQAGGEGASRPLQHP